MPEDEQHVPQQHSCGPQLLAQELDTPEKRMKRMTEKCFFSPKTAATMVRVTAHRLSSFGSKSKLHFVVPLENLASHEEPLPS